jgi:hypothetical protein
MKSDWNIEDKDNWEGLSHSHGWPSYNHPHAQDGLKYHLASYNHPHAQDGLK